MSTTEIMNVMTEIGVVSVPIELQPKAEVKYLWLGIRPGESLYLKNTLKCARCKLYSATLRPMYYSSLKKIAHYCPECAAKEIVDRCI